MLYSHSSIPGADTRPAPRINKLVKGTNFDFRVGKPLLCRKYAGGVSGLILLLHEF
jgi:hypothetical protein